MALIQWDTTFSVGLAAMDKQHQRLIVLINDLNDAMIKGVGKEVVGKTIDGLLDYTKTHFSLEEKLFSQYGFSESLQHKTLHKKFVEKVTDFKQKFDNGGMALSVEVLHFLRDWLRGHIQVEDRKYGVFLNQKGIK